VTTTTTGGGGNKTPLIIVAVVVLLALIGGGIFLATRNTGTAVTSPSVTPRPTPTKTATPRPTPTKTARPSSTSTGTANGFIDCTATPAAVDSYTDAAFADVCALDAPRNRLIAALKAKDAAGSRTAAVALQSAAEASGADVATQTPTTDAEKSADSSLKEGLKDVADGSAALVKAIDATDQAAVNAAGTKIDTGTSLLVVVMALLQPQPRRWPLTTRVTPSGSLTQSTA